MAHLKKIELENFRVFQNKIVIDFHPITILTGANNSGKSSILKSILLLADNAVKTKFLELDFSGDKHNLDAFKYVKNNNSKDNCISINFQLAQFGGDIPEFTKNEMYSEKFFSSFDLDYPKKLDIHLKYFRQDELGKLKEFSLISEDVVLLEVKYNIEQGHSVYLNMDWLLKNDSISKKEDRLFVAEDKIKELLPELSDEELADLFQLLNNVFSEYLSFTQFNEKDWYKWQVGDYLFLESPDEIHLLKEQKAKVITEKEFFDEFSEERINPDNYSKKDFELWWSQIGDKEIEVIKKRKYIVDFKNAAYTDIVKCYLEANEFSGRYRRSKEELSKIINKKQVSELIYSRLKNIAIDDLIMHYTEYNYFIHFENFLNYVYKDISKKIDILFIESFRANTKRIYSNQSQGTDFNQLLLNLHKVKFSHDTEQFIKKWLIEFGIGEDIKFERIKGVATEVKILRKGEFVDLADLGFGTTQLIPIILNIALKVEQSEYIANVEEETERYVNKHKFELCSNGRIKIKNLRNDYDNILPDDQKFKGKTYLKNELFDYRTILIEEPETNLHPNFQSKLADLLVDASKLFNIQFIIETHSEYLIRKLQFLTGKRQINSEDSIIYYFYEPDKIPDNEPQVKKINILESGKLSNEFGNGFFDEADNIAIDLFNMTKLQRI